MALAISNATSNIYYIPLRLGLCANEICGQYTKQGTSIWHDDSGHITEQSSGELSNLLRQNILKLDIFTTNKE